MSKIGRFALMVILCSGIGAQIRESTRAINIEIAVRVFKGDAFVPGLTKVDFEVLEDEKLQALEACYFINKNVLQKTADSNAAKPPPPRSPEIKPDLTRTFVLIFSATRYYPDFGDAVSFFFDNVYKRGDNIICSTPRRAYNFNSNALDRYTKEEAVRQLVSFLKKDILAAGQEYRSLIDQLKPTADSSESGPDPWTLTLLEKLRDLNTLDEKKVLSFADALSKREGQKYVFCILQKALMPIPEALEQEKFLLLRDAGLDARKVKQAFSDRNIQFHFIYATRAGDDGSGLDVANQASLALSGIRMHEFKQDFFSAFKDIADATGGSVESSADAKLALSSAADFSGTYYLLYYAPANYQPDGRFRKIDVRVKSGGVRVVHREGYVAD